MTNIHARPYLCVLLLFVGVVSSGTVAINGAVLGRQTPTMDDASRRLVVSVTDESGKSVPDLTAADFRVLVDGKPVEIKSLTPNDDPASVLFLIDDTASMQIDPRFGDIWKYWTENIQAFARMGNPKNEYGILSFPGDSPTVLDWTKADPEGVSAAMRRYARPENRKKYDPIANFLPAALAMANRAPNRKQAIIVLTDGVAPASSRTRLSEAKEGLRTGSVALYCISVKRAYQGITEAPARSSGLGTLGSVTDLEQELKDLGKLSGGVSFFPASIQQTAISFGLIATILRNQYALEIAKPAPRPGKPTHKVRVEVEAPRALKGKIQLQAHHRAEYVW